VHERFDARRAEPIAQRRPIARSDRKQMIHVSRIDFRWNADVRARQQ
jgi:hypothetical protein